MLGGDFIYWGNPVCDIYIKMEKLYLSYLLEKSNYSSLDDWDKVVKIVSSHLSGDFTFIELNNFLPLGIMTYKTFQKSKNIDELLG